MRRGLPALLVLAVIAGPLAIAPAAPALSGTSGPRAVQLTPAAAKWMMRAVLRREFGPAWSDGTGRRLDCSTAVHPQRGGAAQKNEIRRRCDFSWRHHGIRFAGHGLIWLSGRDAEGSRHWAFQMTVYERTGDHRGTFRQSGAVPDAAAVPRRGYRSS
ncbi:MAG TPA: hypothetical protein VFN85_03120 [Solirubrobacterales bacterium]|nr:hypothetical protein [Solirubrobacterales bacterium]